MGIVYGEKEGKSKRGEKGKALEHTSFWLMKIGSA